jgi:lipopolysaccharide export system protein LptA
MMALTARSLALLALIALAPVAQAQEASIAFGDMAQDLSLPVEVAADQFSVNNADGRAVFTGNVEVKQGEMTLTAAEVRVQYTADQTAIDQLVATGGVSITNLADSAVADQAVYTVATGVIVLTGGVRLEQGGSTLQGQKLTVNLADGSGVMEGRVTTTFAPGATGGN